MYSMYSKVEATKDHAVHSNYKSIWMAKSKDGVHWSDAGTIHEVPEDSEKQIWACAVHKVNDKFVLNYGAYEGKGDTTCYLLKLLVSDDLQKWEYMGKEYDIVSPPNADGSKARIDTVNILKYDNTYYGYGTGRYAFIKSKDGLKWEFSGTTDQRVDFSEMLPKPRSIDHTSIEVGDCAEIGNKYYFLAGCQDWNVR